MAIEIGPSDLARAVSHDPDEDYPHLVELHVVWKGQDGQPRGRTMQISADQFFGRGAFGAPLSGDYVISAIERMRRQGAPTVPQKRKRR